MEPLGCLGLFVVPGFHGSFKLLRAGLCCGVSMGEEVLLEFELLCLKLCLQFIPEELRGLLAPGRDFGYGFVTFFFGGFARGFDGKLEELFSQLSWAW